MDRLAKPKKSNDRLRISTDFLDANLTKDGRVEVDSPRSSFLRKTMADSFNMRRSPSLDGNSDLKQPKRDQMMSPRADIKKHNGTSSLTAN